MTSKRLINFLTVSNDGKCIEARIVKLGDFEIHDTEELQELQDMIVADGDIPLSFMCSSSLDFPEENGATAEVLKLCEAIRNP